MRSSSSHSFTLIISWDIRLSPFFWFCPYGTPKGGGRPCAIFNLCPDTKAGVSKNLTRRRNCQPFYSFVSPWGGMPSVISRNTVATMSSKCWVSSSIQVWNSPRMAPAWYRTMSFTSGRLHWA